MLQPQRAGARVSAPASAPKIQRSWVLVAVVISIVAAPAEPVAIRAAAPRTLSATWLEVREQTTCEAMQDDYCPGRYGFTIKRDGTFIAGPSARGNHVEGQIRPPEVQRVGELIGRVSPTLSTGKVVCKPGGVPGIKDQVDIIFSDETVVRVYDLGGTVGKLCYIGGWNQVRNFHKYLRELMARYYPVPFPKN
jgi:hypothetical protein